MNIYESIVKIMSEMDAIGKKSKNETQGFMYRGIDAVMNALNPLLSKYKVFVVPEVLDIKREERTTSKGNALIYSVVTVKYTFYAEDGSFISSVIVGEGMDSGDKSVNKAMSIAFKYACFQIFCIPTEEMVDPDKESHEVTPKAPALITPEQKAILLSELNRTKVSQDQIIKSYKVAALDDLNVPTYNGIMRRLAKTPDGE